MSRILTVVLALSLVAGLCSAAMAQPMGGRASFEDGRFEDARQGAAQLDLQLSQGVPWRAFTLTDPARLVVDFREVDWTGAEATAIVHTDAVSDLRMGPFRSGWSRLVAVLARPMVIGQAGMTVAEGSGAASLLLRLDPSDPAAMEELSGAPQDPRWDLPPASATADRRGRDGPLRIVLDPGHGGIDPGAERRGHSEANLMLAFARELRDVLRRAGYDAILTRDDDVFVSLEGRVALAHDLRADLFVSLHADAIEEGIAHGASVYTLSGDASDAASEALAERHNRDDLLAGLDLSGSDDRVANVLMDLARLDNGPRSLSLAKHLVGGIRNAVGSVHKRPLRQAGFSVLKAADIPSVLVEVGFLSTARDLELLQDPAWRAGMAAGIRDGIEAWAIEDEALARLRRQ
ncbi:N-acetylmuramoyl-L-alanine amidase [Salipiger pallidus]|uniref:N-acetylmuramoyl-L-alanine amidase n=1 Tax=Salipiger pallidus TaxID=1775170 RepID=A0A8J3EGY6_9RHOB|nr:N-acetylmuramoyl-L-alanine amidase [Salipiger pallidus]GGG74715.1 N-acetylmuramoyl-L-alanine amidase [Salipiger pallidus]